METERLKMLVDSSEDEDPRKALGAAAQLRLESERLQAVAVRRARTAGLSWTEIAALLGVSKQAAHRRYRGGSPPRD